ncbi:LytTR family DNA-binding domain-containing protein [Paenibacillus sp. P26]|nr:LytTR family DNA-binding domain-containing protein [Paenibacillus sp. P26]
MGLTIVIADDEAPAREELSYILSQMDDVEEVIEAASGAEAIVKTKEHRPDVLFLDINMPELSGLSAAGPLAELGLKPKVVFCTAYEKYAVEAFKLRAFHYLLKPFDDEDVRQVLKEVRALEGDSDQPKAAVSSGAQAGSGGEHGIVYASPKDIVYISKEGKNVSVHTKDRAYDAHFTLQELEQKPLGYGFFRRHKSYLVNLEHIAELRYWSNGTFDLHLTDDSRSVVPVSRNYVKELRTKLEI